MAESLLRLLNVPNVSQDLSVGPAKSGRSSAIAFTVASPCDSSISSSMLRTRPTRDKSHGTTTVVGQIEKGSRRVEHVRCPPETFRRPRRGWHRCPLPTLNPGDVEPRGSSVEPPMLRDRCAKTMGLADKRRLLALGHLAKGRAPRLLPRAQLGMVARSGLAGTPRRRRPSWIKGAGDAA